MVDKQEEAKKILKKHMGIMDKETEPYKKDLSIGRGSIPAGGIAGALLLGLKKGPFRKTRALTGLLGGATATSKFMWSRFNKKNPKFKSIRRKVNRSYEKEMSSLYGNKN